MKRDMDLVRAILLKLEEIHAGPNSAITDSDLTIPNYDNTTIAYHIEILIQAKLLSGDFSYLVGGEVSYAIYGITWEGHEFLDLSRNDGTWQRAQEWFVKQGESMSMKLIPSVLSKFITMNL